MSGRMIIGLLTGAVDIKEACITQRSGRLQANSLPPWAPLLHAPAEESASPVDPADARASGKSAGQQEDERREV